MKYSKDLILCFKDEEIEALLHYSSEVSCRLAKLPDDVENFEDLSENFVFYLNNLQDNIPKYLDLVYNNPVLRKSSCPEDDSLATNYVYEALSLDIVGHSLHTYHHINKVLLFPTRSKLDKLMDLELISKNSLKDTSSLHFILLGLSNIRSSILVRLSFLSLYYESMYTELFNFSNDYYLANMKDLGNITALLSNLAGIMYALYSALSSVYTKKYNELVYDIFRRNRHEYPHMMCELFFEFKVKYGGLMVVNVPLATKTKYDIIVQDEQSLILLPSDNVLEYNIKLGDISEKVIISDSDIVFVYGAESRGLQVETSILSLLSLDTNMYRKLIQESIYEYDRTLGLITTGRLLIMNSITCLKLKNYASDLEYLYEKIKVPNDTESNDLKKDEILKSEITIVTPIKKTVVTIDNFNDAVLEISYAPFSKNQNNISYVSKIYLTA